MGLQQLGFNFFDEEPAKETKAAEKLLDKVPIPNESKEETLAAEEPILFEEVTVITVEAEVRDLAFMVEEPAEAVLVRNASKTGNNPAKKNTRGRMKLSDMDGVVDLVEVPEDEQLFQKRYYNIGVVSEMFKVNVSLIRFWENEFDILKPKKNGKGDRLFRPQDIKNLKLIHHLLRERKYTIEGAKDFLKKSKLADQRFGLIDSLKDLRGFLLEIKAGL
jgi:DNA-binding transcriptional MerR regulator